MERKIKEIFITYPYSPQRQNGPRLIFDRALSIYASMEGTVSGRALGFIKRFLPLFYDV